VLSPLKNHPLVLGMKFRKSIGYMDFDSIKTSRLGILGRTFFKLRAGRDMTG
jgi:hypothetical protein